MSLRGLIGRVMVVAVGALFAVASVAQQSPAIQGGGSVAKRAKPAKKPSGPAVQMGLEPRAIEILKASSARLAAVKSMAFTAVISYESPSRLGPPLVYSTKAEVTLQRPDKLKVINVGDGPPTEFYYDGKVMMAFAPGENLVAVAEAPPTIDGALLAAYDSAAIYFPFADVIVADPYKDIADGLKVAFYIGRSSIVGGTTTEMVAYVTGDVFVQIWIGAEDKLPRRVYAVYLKDRARLRHVLDLSSWRIDAVVAADAFISARAAGAQQMKFARPDARSAAGMKPPPKAKVASARAAPTQ